MSVGVFPHQDLFNSNGYLRSREKLYIQFITFTVVLCNETIPLDHENNRAKNTKLTSIRKKVNHTFEDILNHCSC